MPRLGCVAPCGETESSERPHSTWGLPTSSVFPKAEHPCTQEPPLPLFLICLIKLHIWRLLSGQLPSDIK